jgi:DNA ligase-1
MDVLAAVCERVASYGGRLRKVGLVAEYLKTLDDEDLVRAVKFLCAEPLVHPPTNATLFGRQTESRTLSVGYAALRQATLAITGWDGQVVGRCHEEVGDAGETIGLLLFGRTHNEPLTLAQAELLYAELYRARSAAGKVEILKRVFQTYRPLAIKYFVKVITGDLRIGLQVKMVEEAVAGATGRPLQEVRLANNRLGDLAHVALSSRHDRLHTIEARLFHPMDFMLAKPLDSLADLPDPANYLVEHKYDGIRSQAHVADGQAMLYSRGMDDVTAAFPELASALRKLESAAVLDGEIVAWKDGRALAFNVLQQRIARKRVTASFQQEIPAVFLAYDLLYKDGELLLDTPLERRRALLEQALNGHSEPLLLSPQYEAPSIEDVDRLFGEARESGNEGLVLKRRGSLYEPGRRSGTWYKVKRPYATLDVVITAAEQGHGRRATVLSDYTFAVQGDGRLLNVGKAYSGLTDDEIRELTGLLRALTIEKYGRVLLVKPEIVLEVAFDAIQKSARHKSGYALRFPRIVRWRKDKKATEIDTVERVRELYEASIRT